MNHVPVHYGPTPTPGMAAWKRVALCGITYAIGGGSVEYRAEAGVPEVFGTSNLTYVTCCDCLDVLEARKRIQESANG